MSWRVSSSRGWPGSGSTTWGRADLRSRRPWATPGDRQDRRRGGGGPGRRRSPLPGRQSPERRPRRCRARHGTTAAGLPVLRAQRAPAGRNRRRKSAHLRVEGPRTDAIRRAVADQLGLEVVGVEAIGLAGSRGVDAARLHLADGTSVFGKLYASPACAPIAGTRPSARSSTGGWRMRRRSIRCGALAAAGGLRPAAHA